MSDAAPALAIVSSIGSVCELPAVTKFFNGNPMLGSLGGGIDAFSGRSGPQALDRDRARSSAAAGTTSSTRSTRSSPSRRRRGRVGEGRRRARPSRRQNPRSRRRPDRGDDVDDDVDDRRRRGSRRRGARVTSAPRPHGAGQRRGLLDQGRHRPDPHHDRGGTYYTLRCYLDDAPVLPRPQRPDQRVRLRAVAGALPGRRARPRPVRSGTYDDIRTAATDGSLRVDVTDENVYVLSGLGRRPRRRSRRRRSRPAGARRRIAPRRRRILRGRPSSTRSLDADQATGQAGRLRAGSRHGQQADARRTPTRSSSGKRWRPSSSRGCGPNSFRVP